MPIIDMPPSRAEWLALRQKYLGASEISALFGVQANYSLDHFALYHVKAGNVPPPEVGGQRVEWGKRLEEVVAMAVAEEHGYIVRKGRYAICDDCPGMAASLDFSVDADVDGEFEGPGILETKNVADLVHRKSWTDHEPPIHILLQLQHQLGCTGYKWGIVAGLVGGNDLKIYRYAARPKLIADIKSRVVRFWSDIEAGRVPDTSGSESSGEVLRSLYQAPIDDAIDMSGSNEWSESVAQFIEAGAVRKAANEAYDEAKNRVVALLGNHKRGWGAGYSVNTAITPEKPDRPAREGEIIRGRAETRRYTAKEIAA
jgi:predicted phage-related endonuclease